MTVDTIVYDTAAALLECARLGLEEWELPAPCRVCVVPGEIAWDSCENGGQLAISRNRVYYSNVFPTEITQDTVVPAACGPGIVVADYTLSLVRCAPQPKGNPPRPPTCDALSDVALLLDRDAYALRSALLCCLRDLRNDRTIIEWRLGSTQSVGPNGGCVGNTLQILVGYTNG